MNKIAIFTLVLLVGATILGGCKKKETGFMTVTMTGLPDLGPGFAYEGWLIVDGNALTAGVFTVDNTGNMSSNSFEINQEDLDNAITYVLTIEPNPDPDPKPSAVHLLAGDFSGNKANLSVGHRTALNTDFSTATGSYILATPTDGNTGTDENSGIWWLNPATGPGPGLELPSLPVGWSYEGWAVVDGIPVSTGKFTAPDNADGAGTYSGSFPGPQFPGEDFLVNAPAGLSFPVDLSGSLVVISVEPDPDNSILPFVLKPLTATVPNPATDHTSYPMTNTAVATNPAGTVTR